MNVDVLISFEVTGARVIVNYGDSIFIFEELKFMLKSKM